MEPVTHALTSIALGRAGLNKVTRVATPMLVVSGTIADVDWVTRLGGASAFLHGHRTATHSAIGTAVIIAGVSAAFWLAGRKYPKLAVGIFPALLICTAGAGVHLLMDLLNDYGVQLLWPFTSKWYAWDLAGSVDGWILFFLLCGLLIPELFRLVHEEIGAKPKKTGRRRGVIVGLSFVVLFVAGRGFAHQRAIALLDSRLYSGEAPLEVAAFPRPSNPLVWSGVVETDNALVTVDVPLGPLSLSVFDPDLGDVYFKPEQSLALKNAVNTATAVDFLSCARFPLAHVEPEGPGYQVRLRDMRFASERPGRRGIIAIIHLNAQSLVVSERLEFDSFPGR
jgi:inner membrane protein